MADFMVGDLVRIKNNNLLAIVTDVSDGCYHLYSPHSIGKVSWYAPDELHLEAYGVHDKLYTDEQCKEFATKWGGKVKLTRSR